MKNREKYKDELIKTMKTENKLCEFMNQHDVFRIAGMARDMGCEVIRCEFCLSC